MKTQSIDTHPDAERVQIELLRKATVEQRFRLTRSLIATSRRLARQAIQEAHPDASEDEIALMFVAIHYGQEWADRLRPELAKRHL